jgi:hypothetical protein
MIDIDYRPAVNLPLTYPAQIGTIKHKRQVKITANFTRVFYYLRMGQKAIHLRQGAGIYYSYLLSQSDKRSI